MTSRPARSVSTACRARLAGAPGRRQRHLEHRDAGPRREPHGPRHGAHRQRDPRQEAQHRRSRAPTTRTRSTLTPTRGCASSPSGGSSRLSPARRAVVAALQGVAAGATVTGATIEGTSRAPRARPPASCPPPCRWTSASGQVWRCSGVTFTQWRRGDRDPLHRHPGHAALRRTATANFDVTAPGPPGSYDIAFTPYGAFLPACTQRLNVPVRPRRRAARHSARTQPEAAGAPRDRRGALVALPRPVSVPASGKALLAPPTGRSIWLGNAAQTLRWCGRRGWQPSWPSPPSSCCWRLGR